MKIRKGFISNSSSCSFIFKTREPLTEQQAQKFFKNYEYNVYYNPDPEALLEEWVSDIRTQDFPEYIIEKTQEKNICDYDIYKIKIPKELSAKYLVKNARKIDFEFDIDLLIPDFEEKFNEYFKQNYSNLYNEIIRVNNLFRKLHELYNAVFSEYSNIDQILDETIKALKDHLDEQILQKIEQLRKKQKYEAIAELIERQLRKSTQIEELLQKANEIEEAYKKKLGEKYKKTHPGVYYYKIHVEGSGNGWVDVHSNSIYEKEKEDVFTDDFLKNHLVQVISY